MATVYHDADANLADLKDETLAVIGYGNQGRAQAQNLRDSGLRVIVGNIGDAARTRAGEEGFEAFDIGEACRRADLILLLIPDEIMPDVYREQVAPHLEPGNALDFASGYNVAFGRIHPPETVDVFMVAPRMIGVGVRDTFVAGQGFPSFVGVHQDASGRALRRMLALARGIGSTRAGCIEMSLHDEASLDLFTEQGFGPAFGQVLMTAVNLLVEKGYPPEAVLLELLLSGELEYSFGKMREVGVLEQMDFHSQTSQYGSITRAGKFAHLGAPLRQAMDDVLGSIRSGAFADEWSGMKEKGAEILANVKEARSKMPFAEWERSTREAFRIGEEGIGEEA